VVIAALCCTMGVIAGWAAVEIDSIAATGRDVSFGVWKQVVMFREHDTCCREAGAIGLVIGHSCIITLILLSSSCSHAL